MDLCYNRRDFSEAKEVNVTGRLDNKVAIVTGGASGIGRAACSRFLEEGANVVIADRNSAGAEETQALWEDLQRTAISVVDISKADQVERMVEETVPVSDASMYWSTAPGFLFELRPWLR